MLSRRHLLSWLENIQRARLTYSHILNCIRLGQVVYFKQSLHTEISQVQRLLQKSRENSSEECSWAGYLIKNNCRKQSRSRLIRLMARRRTRTIAASITLFCSGPDRCKALQPCSLRFHFEIPKRDPLSLGAKVSPEVRMVEIKDGESPLS